MRRGSESHSSESTGREATNRNRDRAKTEAALQAELNKLLLAGIKPTVTAIAAAVGVTPPLVHNTYPEIASSIRKLSGKGGEVTAAAEALKALKKTNRELHAGNRRLLAEVARLASINQVLIGELALIKGQSTATVVSLLVNRSLPPQKS
jgi:hypothetical protein